MKFDPYHFEQPFRPNYELYSTIGWGAFGAIGLATAVFATIPPFPIHMMSAACFGMMAYRAKPAYKLHKMQKALEGRELSFMTLKEIDELMSDHPRKAFWGFGFDWENRHLQRVFNIMGRDWSEVVNPSETLRGKKWIHGVETEEKTILQPLEHLSGHTLIMGTTGSGKTRMFDHLISQAIMRGENVWLCDPKGDREMRNNAKRACEHFGRADDFIEFHPAFPERSIHIDPLANYARVTELASRIAQLINASAGGEVFRDFSQMALNHLIQGIIISEEKPTLVKIRRYLDGGAQSLICSAIEKYVLDRSPSLHSKLKVETSGFNPEEDVKKAAATIKFYDAYIKTEHPSVELEGLISMYRHDRAHLSKMIASLLPVMNMLTSDSLGRLLSPDRSIPDSASEDQDMPLPWDTRRIIERNKVFYMGLDTLSDGIVGSAIGELILSDLTATAGDRYNFGENLKPVSIFIDEAAEVINEPMIQLLNKSRGSLFTLYVASQTINDLAAKLGDENKAQQVLGNFNNFVALRLNNDATKEYFAEMLPKTRVRDAMEAIRTGSAGDEPTNFSGSHAQSVTKEESSFFPKEWFGLLPDLEFIANLSGGRIVKARLPILVEEKKNNQ
jgi:conjugal transfer pilus assembly protein TraD